MNDSRGPGQARDPRVGLCDDCAHARIVRNARGSAFYLCELSFTDARFSKYPPLPVVQCAGYCRVDPPRDEPC